GPSKIFMALAILPSNPLVLYAGTNFSGVLKSTNGGLSWTPINSAITQNATITALAIDPSANGTIYAANEDSNVVFETKNGGVTWVANSNLSVPATGINALISDPSRSSTVYAATYNGVMKTNNQGATWFPTGPNRGNGTLPATTISLVIGD